jgi:hypothetical protein
MIMSRIALSCFFCIIWRSCFAAYPQEKIPADAVFVSPDGRYSVGLQEIDGLTRFAIKDATTGGTDNSIVMPSLLLYLHWAPNSRAIITVEHIPHGSCGRVIYLNNNKWNDAEIRPPVKSWIDSTVTNLKTTQDRAHFRFAVRYIKANGLPFDYKFCDLDVNLQSGQVSNVTWTSSSQEEHAASLARKPIYSPPMDTT